MFAVVDINGQQVKVQENEKYYVPKLDKKPNSQITFDKVLLLGDEKETKIGSPFIDGLKIKAKVLEHIKDEKVIVFKKKRRTGYQKKNGHRQQLTKIEITKIG
jgi:large subunit ribosomal protein L21